MNNALAHPLAPNTDRLWDDIMGLSAIVDADSPGWTREVFSDPYKASRSWTLARMRDAGLQAHIDGAGNIVGRLPGTNPNAPAIVTGSHTDTCIRADASTASSVSWAPSRQPGFSRKPEPASPAI